MPTVTLNTGRSFPAEPSVSILDAARAAGVVLPYSCRTGRCSVCKAPVDSGATTPLRAEESLTGEEAAAGLILTCCRAATEDVALDVEPLDRLVGYEPRTIPARITSIERLAPNILKVVLRTPPASPLRFLPGQYVDVIADGGRRSYSLANAPRDDNQLELLIKRYPGGHLSGFFFDRASPDDLVRIEGPLGTFYLRDEMPGDLLCLATGTGIAPLKAILEELAADPARLTGHRLRVFWGNRRAEEFVWEPAPLDLPMEFHHVVSGEETGWKGRRGRVPHAALTDGFDPTRTAVYACGSDAMIASARDLFTAEGLPSRLFFSDAFVRSS